MLKKEMIHPDYRADIDGLRAIAIIAVVIFHAFPTLLTGGFVGVDIFFVISGYLISQIIIKNLTNNSFSFKDFYARRIRRLFPGLLIVLSFSYFLGWFALLADEYKQLGKHIASASVFISNFVLIGEANYFDNIGETKPLLHLWSLGVEEQFYIFWPFLIWVSLTRKINLILLSVVLILISFFLSVTITKSNPTLGFYLPQTRFWELMLGCQLIFLKNHIVFSNKTRTISLNFLSIFGFLILIFCFFKLNKTIQFPGWYSVIPVIGTSMLLFAGPSAWFNRNILSSKVMVWFGLISYPLYLWHWPLLSFARITQSTVPTFIIRFVLVIVSVFFAWLTYIFLEKPTRKAFHSKLVLSLLILFMAIIGIVGFDTFIRDGLPFRKNAYLNGYDSGHTQFHKYVADNFYLCTPESLAKKAPIWNGYTRCMQSKRNKALDIAIIGDSHAEHLFPGLADLLPTKNIVFYIQSSMPLVSNPELSDIFRETASNKSITTVILTMDWMDRRVEVSADGQNFRKYLLKDIDFLDKSGKKIIIINDIPKFPFGPDKCISRRWLALNGPTCNMDFDEYKKQLDSYSGLLQEILQRNSNINFIDISKYLCDKRTCEMKKEGRILYRDNNHLSVDGSLYIGKKIIEQYPEFFN